MSKVSYYTPEINSATLEKSHKCKIVYMFIHIQVTPVYPNLQT